MGKLLFTAFKFLTLIALQCWTNAVIGQNKVITCGGAQCYQHASVSKPCRLCCDLATKRITTYPRDVYIDN